jgi:dipeptidyl-peptidase-4
MPKPFDTITIEQVARFPRPGTVVPGALRFTPDSKALTYLFSAEGSLVRSLWRYDLATGDTTILAGPPPATSREATLSREEELRRERARQRELGVTSYEFAKDSPEPVILIPVGGKLQVIRGAAAEPREVPGVEGAVDPHLNRTGAAVAYVRDGDLYTISPDGGEPRRLTHDAADGLTNGLADFIHQEELDQDRGFWWSDDGRSIAFVRADARHIPSYPIVHQGKEKWDAEHHRYPFAGDPNARLQLGVVSLDDGMVRWMDLGGDDDIYLPRTWWTPDGRLRAEILSRDQKRLQLVTFDGESGACRVLIDERREPWINLNHDTRFLKSGEILRASEATGFNHLYLHDRDGRELRQLTSGEWLVTGVVSVDEERRQVYFTGTRESVLERHLYRVSLDGGDIERLTDEPGSHGAAVSPDGEWYVDFHSTLVHAPTVTLRRTDRSSSTVLFENAGNSAEELGLDAPEFVHMSADDGTPLYGAIYRPPAFDRSKKYPLIVSVYGGPHAQRVAAEWSNTVDLRAQWLARQGYLVFKLDNRGSANRGLAFEAHLNRRFGTVEVEDQAAGVRYLAKNDAADIERVGVYGWSYGGYMTLLCMTKEPDLFRVGVAGAPVVDFADYDTGYTERYMGTPDENREGYTEGSVLTHVRNLRGKLMVVHGMVDENVHFRNTARLLVALAEEQKPYDLLLFPEERHMPRDAKGLEYQERRVLEYFTEHL